MTDVIQVPAGSSACWSDNLLLSPIAGKQRDGFSHPPVCEVMYSGLANEVEKLVGLNVEKIAPRTEKMFLVQKICVQNEQACSKVKSWFCSRLTCVNLIFIVKSYFNNGKDVRKNAIRYLPQVIMSYCSNCESPFHNEPQYAHAMTLCCSTAESMRPH